MGLTHHTKNKGDLGVAKAHADLVAQGYIVLFPTTEHAPFDLVAYDDGIFIRVQVKYRTAKAGRLYVQFKSTWSDRSGTHGVLMDKTSVDIVCIYCPETDECYYVRPLEHGNTVTLRVRPTRNGQILGVLQARSVSERSSIAVFPQRRGPGYRNGTKTVDGREDLDGEDSKDAPRCDERDARDAAGDGHRRASRRLHA